MAIRPLPLPSIWHTYMPGPIQSVDLDLTLPPLAVLRLDLLQSWASGNKYFKLKYALAAMLEQGKTHVVSKGGMFSNHLAALAEACQSFNIDCTAVVRSYVEDEDNPSIMRLRTMGAEVLYKRPEDYQLFDQASAMSLFPGCTYIPEGGLSDLGIRGASEIVREFLPWNPSHVVVAGGTLGTFAGILSVAPANMTVIVVPAWKGCTIAYVQNVLLEFKIKPVCRWELWPDSHWGGFGKYTDGLLDFIRHFEGMTGIPLDPVYTSKMMYAVLAKRNEGYFDADARILALHTGGIQGMEGVTYRQQKKASG